MSEKPDTPSPHAAKPDDSSRRKRNESGSHAHRRHRSGPSRSGRGQAVQGPRAPGIPRAAQVVIKGDNVDVAHIMTAIKQRIHTRRLTMNVPTQEHIGEYIDNLERTTAVKHSIPQAEIKAMLGGAPGWNINDAYPISSHRAVVGGLIVAIKKISRRVAGLFARPLLSRQAEINSYQSLVSREVIHELARQNAELQSTVMRLEAVMRRVGMGRAVLEPLVVFEDGAGGEKERRKRPRSRPHRSRGKGARPQREDASGGNTP